MSPSTRPGRVRGRPGPRRRIRIRAITGRNPGLSCRCPALVTREIGRHRRSAAEMGFQDSVAAVDLPFSLIFNLQLREAELLVNIVRRVCRT